MPLRQCIDCNKPIVTNRDEASYWESNRCEFCQDKFMARMKNENEEAFKFSINKWLLA